MQRSQSAEDSIDQVLSGLVSYIRELYGDGVIALHQPLFSDLEKNYVIDCIDSNIVSSIGERVGDFEDRIKGFTGAEHSIATINGTSALHTALLLAGVHSGDEVISQALTFVATCNAIRYCGANPLFIDVDQDTLGLSPRALEAFLKQSAVIRQGSAWNKHTGRRIAACVPMHTFGLPCRIVEIVTICKEWGIPVVEDAAESLGSFVKNRHTGTFGKVSAISFNGNKIVTTGGGGVLITDDGELARRARHITTTAKVPHVFNFFHDETGYNYRLPNINAALGCAQMQQLPSFLEAKRRVAQGYRNVLSKVDLTMPSPLPGDCTNNWLNAVVMKNRQDRDKLLAETNRQSIMTRPAWQLMSALPMFSNCQNDGLEMSRWLEERLVNLPSSVPRIRLERGLKGNDHSAPFNEKDLKS